MERDSGRGEEGEQREGDGEDREGHRHGRNRLNLGRHSCANCRQSSNHTLGFRVQIGKLEPKFPLSYFQKVQLIELENETLRFSDMGEGAGGEGSLGGRAAKQPGARDGVVKARGRQKGSFPGVIWRSLEPTCQVSEEIGRSGGSDISDFPPSLLRRASRQRGEIPTRRDEGSERRKPGRQVRGIWNVIGYLPLPAKSG